MRISMLLIFCVAFAAFASPLSADDDMQAGVAVVDITPPIPYRMSGYFSERASTGVHDRLMAKAIVFRQGDEHAALVFCDLIGIAPDVSKKVRSFFNS